MTHMKYSAGPLPELSKRRFFMRTIYSWFILSLLIPNRRGNYDKLTEGLSQDAYESIMKVWNDGGIWVWLCSSISTEKGRQHSYIYGAVFISHIISTEQYKKKYRVERTRREFKNSEKFEWQAIIPANKYARLILKERIELHKTKSERSNKCEQRIFGVWEPRKDAEETLKLLKKPCFTSG